MYVIKLDQIETRYKYIAVIKPLYEILHDWFMEHNYKGRFGGDKYMETLYYLDESQSGYNYWIWWRLFKTINSQIRFFVSFDMLALAVHDVQVIWQGKKYKAQKAEFTFFINAQVQVDYNNQWDGYPEPFGHDNGMCEDGVWVMNDYCEVCRGEQMYNPTLGCGPDHDGVCEPGRGEYWTTSLRIRGENPDGTPCSGEVDAWPSLDCYPDWEQLTASCNHDGVCDEDAGENVMNCIDCSCTGSAVYIDPPIEIDGVEVARGWFGPWCQRYLGENEITCPEECGCDNDGVCEVMRGESEANCVDCGCDYDSECEFERGETTQSCPSDCLRPTMWEVCGDHMCDPYVEDQSSCPEDCDPVPTCGNGKCEPPTENKYACPSDCDPDVVCGGPPPCLNYRPTVDREVGMWFDIIYVIQNQREPDSCPGCGNGDCNVICGETPNSCPSDCFPTG